jgi:hypothetical protein
MLVHAESVRAYTSPERDSVARQSEQMIDMLIGMSLLFGCVGGLILCVGIWLGAPYFALSALFAFAASLTFAFCSRRLARLDRITSAKPPLARPTARPTRTATPYRKAA